MARGRFEGGRERRRHRGHGPADTPHPPRLGASHAPVQPEHRWLSRLRWALRLCALVLVVELGYVLLTSPTFAIRTLELRGDANVCEEIAEHLQLPRNTNYFLAPTRQLARQVASFPAVRAVRVARDFPNRLVVTLERREPVAVIREGDRALLVDAQGVIYTIRNEWAWGLPELVAPHLTPRAVRESEARAEVAKLLAVLEALGPNPQLGVTRLLLDRGEEVTAVLESGTEVRLGTPEQLPTKIELLAAVLRQIAPERIATLDLSDPNGAYWRPREPEGAAMVEVR